MAGPRKKDIEAAKAGATSAVPIDRSKPVEEPRFRSTRGKPVMLASTMGGHTASVTHTEEGTPLHPRFHRQAVMEGCLPLASFSEVQESDQAVVASAGRDRKSMLRGCIADMVLAATEDATREKEFFDGDGRPRTDVMSERLGFPIQTSERDAAWKEYAGDDDGNDEGEDD